MQDGIFQLEVGQAANGGAADIDIQIVGRDMYGNRAVAEQLLSKIKHVPGTADLRIGQYRLTLDHLESVQGPNFTADRTVIRVTRHGRLACNAEPERRFYPANRQSTSKIALCFEGINDLYVVAGDTRTAANGQPGQLIRAYWNPWVRFIFLGPVLMALGGLISLADRRLRLAVGRRAVVAQGARA